MHVLLFLQMKDLLGDFVGLYFVKVSSTPHLSLLLWIVIFSNNVILNQIAQPMSSNTPQFS